MLVPTTAGDDSTDDQNLGSPGIDEFEPNRCAIVGSNELSDRFSERLIRSSQRGASKSYQCRTAGLDERDSRCSLLERGEMFEHARDGLPGEQSEYLGSGGYS